MECITNRGELSMRTKLMEIAPAGRFARCLRANPRFTAVQIESNPRAKGDACYFVTFLPSSPERLEALAQRQQDARADRALSQAFTFCADKDSGRLFHWCHSHATGEVYEVTPESCNCPDHEYRCAPNGLLCKHQIALLTAVRDGAVAEFTVLPSEPAGIFAMTENVNLCDRCAPEYGLATEGAEDVAAPCDDCGRSARGRFDAARFAEIFG